MPASILPELLAQIALEAKVEVVNGHRSARQLPGHGYKPTAWRRMIRRLTPAAENVAKAI